MSWTAGAFIGPILSGYLTEQIGYYEMNCVIGSLLLSPFLPCRVETNICTAVLCALSTVNALWNLKSKTRASSQGQPDDRN